MSLEIAGRFDTGQYFLYIQSRPGFFSSGLTTALFHAIGKVPVKSDLLMIFLISGARVRAVDLRREPGIGSSSHDFPLDLHIRL